MSLRDELERVFDKTWAASEARQWIHGRLGRKDTDGTIKIKTGKANFVHVRLNSAGGTGHAIAYNKGVPLKAHLPIRMRLDPDKGYLVIYDTEIGGVYDQFTGGNDNVNYDVGRHTHAIYSGLEYNLEALRFNPGRPQCDADLDVKILPFRYFFNGAWDTWENTGTIDVTSYLPASGKWAWIVVGVDPATNTLVAAKSADQDAQADLTAALIDTVTFTGYIPCGAVQATSSDTTLANISRWQDARNWLSTAGYAATVDVAKSFDIYIDKKERLSEENVHGGLASLATAQPLDSVPTDLPVTAGIGKILVVVNAGSDLAGTITVTGTSVDRDTGVETGADTDTLAVDAVTTDGSGTDSNSNVIHAFTGAYITDKWFKGAVVLSTADLTLTDVDVWQVCFEQFGDNDVITLDTVDFSAVATHTSAWANIHLYSLSTTTGDKCNIVKEASVGIDAADVTANKWYRLRESDIDTALDGSTDGIWVEQFLGPMANTYWEDINGKVWYTHQINVVGDFATTASHSSMSDLDADDHVHHPLLAGRDGDILRIDEIRAYDAAGLKLFEDGGAGIFIKDSTGYVGIGTVVPIRKGHFHEASSAACLIQITNDTTGATSTDGFQVGIGGNENGRIWQYEDNYIVVGTNNIERVRILTGGNVGIATAVPGQIFDVNSGSGNMIADGYDSHSLGEYKEQVEDALIVGAMAKLASVPFKQWTRRPFVSTQELVDAAREYFGLAAIEDVRGWYKNLDEGAPERIWIDNRRQQLREDRRKLARWQRRHVGLVADDPATMAAIPHVVSKDDDDNPTGISLAEHVGLLHAALLDLNEQLNALPN